MTQQERATHQGSAYPGSAVISRIKEWSQGTMEQSQPIGEPREVVSAAPEEVLNAQFDRRLSLARAVSISGRSAASALVRGDAVAFAQTLPLAAESLPASDLEKLPAVHVLHEPYDQFARSSLRQAMRFRNPDGSLDLYGAKVLADDVKQRVALPSSSSLSHAELYDRFEDENARTLRRLDYMGGISAALWQMGFVSYGAPDRIGVRPHQAEGEFNPALTETHDGQVTYMSLPYDPTNEFHAMVAGDQIISSHAVIDLTVDDGNRFHTHTAPALTLAIDNRAPLIELPARQ